MRELLSGKLVCSIAASAILCGCCADNGKELTLLVGSYTSGTEACGIHSYSFNTLDGSLELKDSVNTPDASFLSLSADGKTIYAVRESGCSDDAAIAIPIDGYAFGKPSEAMLTNGEAPCYIANNGKLLLTANYSGGSLSVFPLGEDGMIGRCSEVIKGSDHVHCSIFAPDGNYVLATDFAADQIVSFRICGNGSSLEPRDTIHLSPATGPRHICFNEDGSKAYVIGELSGAVTAMDYSNGKLVAFQEVQADSLNAHGSADIHISPDGRHLYASNRLKGDGIAIFEIAPDGRLSKNAYQDTGIHPRNFCFSPDGRYLLCACRDSNCVQIYEVDIKTGLLSFSGKQIKLNKPVFVLFK